MAGYSHEFLLAVLASRTFAYYVFKRFGEVDPARAHVKLTHARLASMPVPKLDFSSAEQRHRHTRIVASVHRLLDGSADLGGSEDLDIEQAIRELWGLTPEQGAYINGEFVYVPPSQAVQGLFPAGIPGAREIWIGS